MIIGHEKLIDFFANAAEAGKLGHAYCFVGPGEVGKMAVANHIAATLLKTEPEKLTGHPDYVYLEREIDEKTGKLKKDISVKQARALKERLQNRSWLGGYQVVVIDEAELINDEAGNALLKILEEPPKQSVIFLLTVDERALLPTVRSRCQSFFFSLVRAEAIAAGLEAMGRDKETAAQCARLSWGRPGRAVRLSRDAEERNNYYRELERLRRVVGAPFYAKVQALEELFGKKDEDAARKRDHWRAVLGIWQMVWRDALVGGKNSGETDLIKFRGLPQQKILSVIDGLKAAEKLMGENINPRLLIEETILKF